jgi:2-dehydropantoate 2-reductase
MTNPRILLMGCGGIGGIMGAKLVERGADVMIVTHNPSIAAAINARGLALQDETRRHSVPAQVEITIPEHAGAFDFVFLATQPPQVEEAARSALPHLRAGGAMVGFQNGLCEQRIAAIAGVEQTLGAIVAWGGSMLEPGVYERTSEGGFVIGRLGPAAGVLSAGPLPVGSLQTAETDRLLNGVADARLETLRALLEAIGPVKITNNLRGARWSKLAINCAISSLGTIGGDRLGALLRYRFVRRLALEVMTEVVAVARARGVRLEKVSGTIDLDWVALTDSERVVSGSPTLLAKHALLLAVGAKFRRLRSSMLIAIERGREPAVDFLNGEVVWRGQRSDVPVRLNARIVEMIHEIARGRLHPGVPLLRQLYVASRADFQPPRFAGGARDAAASAFS